MKALPLALFASLALMLVATKASAESPSRLAKEVQPRALTKLILSTPAPQKVAFTPRAATKMQPAASRLGSASPNPPPQATVSRRAPRLAPHIRRMPLKRRDPSSRFPPAGR